ncbi:aspartyl protease family protein [Microcoleus sp. herbarium7]|uniref:aspartyl protease family protein n=1 Tax=Microcoleus sp. herbarium7 TaxID=3055435 RepID=UPI003FA53DEC
MAPYLPIALSYQNRSLQVSGLLDTGASVNVLPYEIGLQLGAVWEEQTISVVLTGNLAQFLARGLVVSAQVGQFSPVRLAFAWTQANNVPLILGRQNFFSEFDVCFYGSQLAFEVCPKQNRSN